MSTSIHNPGGIADSLPHREGAEPVVPADIPVHGLKPETTPLSSPERPRNESASSPRQRPMRQLLGKRPPWMRGMRGLFALLVLLPIGMAAIYLYGVASDRYLSEARFTIRDNGSVNEPASIDIGTLLGGGGGGSRQDAYMIRDYILSPDLLALLEREMGLRAAWSSPDIDPLWRLAPDASQEDFLEYYRDVVSVLYDTESGIIRAELQGFEPEFTRHMLDMILVESEHLVNDISHRLAQEQLKFITQEIDTNTARLKAAKTALVAFQNENEVVDPKGELGVVTGVISQMEGNLAAEKTRLTAMQGYLDPNAPELVALRNQVDALSRQIAVERNRLTGSGGPQLNTVMARYEELLFDVEFANERFRMALMALEKVQIEAAKKVKSLVVVSRPNLPDEALLPDRTYVLATMAAFLLMGFGILSVVLAAIRERME